MLKRKIVKQETMTDKTTLGEWLIWRALIFMIFDVDDHTVLYGADVNDKK